MPATGCSGGQQVSTAGGCGRTTGQAQSGAVKTQARAAAAALVMVLRFRRPAWNREMKLALIGQVRDKFQLRLTDDWHVDLSWMAVGAFRPNRPGDPRAVSSGVFCCAPNRPIRECVFGSHTEWQRRWCV